MSIFGSSGPVLTALFILQLVRRLLLLPFILPILYYIYSTSKQVFCLTTNCPLEQEG